jgi:hypothetical protein
VIHAVTAMFQTEHADLLFEFSNFLKLWSAFLLTVSKVYSNTYLSTRRIDFLVRRGGAGVNAMISYRSMSFIGLWALIDWLAGCEKPWLRKWLLSWKPCSLICFLC